MQQRRFISMLLVFMLLFSLCSTTVWAEGDTVYATKSKELLIRKTESGAGFPDNTSPVLGRALDRVTEYTYDEFGNVTEERTRLANPAMTDFLKHSGQGASIPAGTESIVLDTRSTVNGYGIMKQYDFEDGVLIHLRTFVKDYDDTIVEENYTYYDQGQLKSSESTSYMDSLLGEYDVPGQRLYEFDENGYCTHWYNVGEDGMGETNVTYTYNSYGKLTCLSLSINGGEPQTMTPVYEDGVQVATIHVAPDGGQVEQRFSYDDEGRVNLIEYEAAEPHIPEYLFYVDGYAGETRYNVYKAGDRHITIALTYNDQGFVQDAEWRTDGNFVVLTQYEYPVDADGVIGYSATDNEYGPFLWGGSLSSTYWVDDKEYTTKAGNPMSEESYSLEILGSNLRYVSSETSYEYDTRNIKYGAPSQAWETDINTGIYYPPLKASYGGIPVPVPDGTERLMRVIMRSSDIPVVADLSYLEDGAVAGETLRFDPVIAAPSATLERDEWGRLTKATYEQYGYSIEYSYAEDGQSYTRTFVRDAGTPSVMVINLKDQNISDLVGRTPEKVNSNGLFEYNEDDLPIRSVTPLGNGETRENRYTYSYDTWEDGSLKALLRQDNDSTYTYDILTFDEHGYLERYFCYYNPSPSITFSYQYETIS